MDKLLFKKHYTFLYLINKTRHRILKSDFTLDLFCEYTLCGGCPWRLLRHTELFATWPHGVFGVLGLLLLCWLFLPSQQLFPAPLLVSTSSFLCASHPDMLIIVGCELGKQISKFIQCLKKKALRHLSSVSELLHSEPLNVWC